jgi:hypothetical protein
MTITAKLERGEKQAHISNHHSFGGASLTLL